MSDGAVGALLLVGAGLGGYALYRHFSKKGGSEFHHHGGSPSARGYFTGAGSHGVDYVDPADSRRDARSGGRNLYYLKPYQILNIGPGMRPMEIDAQGAPTGRVLVLPGESSGGLEPGSYVFVGQGGSRAPDPRGCLCPENFDPLNPSLEQKRCPCDVPGAVKPPYAGYYAAGRGGARHFHHRMPHHHMSQQQQDDDES